MATFDYSRQAGSALRILAKFGSPVTLRRKEPGEYDPAKGTVTPGAQTEIPTIGVRLNYDQKDIDGSKIRHSDQHVYLAVTQDDGSPVPRPQTGDVLMVESGHWTVVEAQEISPAGIPVLFIVQVRK